MMRVVGKPLTFIRVNLYQHLSDILQEQRALVAQVVYGKLEVIGIDHNKPSNNFADAMGRKDSGGAKVCGSTTRRTRTGYKVEQGVVQKRKIRLCV